MFDRSNPIAIRLNQIFLLSVISCSVSHWQPICWPNVRNLRGKTAIKTSKFLSKKLLIGERKRKFWFCCMSCLATGL